MGIFQPLTVFADVVPFLGNMVGGVVGLFAFLLGTALTLMTIALAWVAVRPLLAIPALIVAFLMMGGGAMIAGKGKSLAAATEAFMSKLNEAPTSEGDNAAAAIQEKKIQ